MDSRSTAQRAHRVFCALTSVSLIIPSGALAQTAPDPISTLRRDTDQAERALRPRSIDKPDAPAAKAEAAAPDDVPKPL